MLTFDINERSIYLADSVVDIFRQFRNLKRRNESGGVVLGQVDETERRILVCRASIPSELDESAKNAFYRDMRAAKQIVEYEFYNSLGKNTYLGEWHTHPAKKAIPSNQDVKMIKEQFEISELRVNFILMFVVASSEMFIGLYNGKEISSVTVLF